MKHILVAYATKHQSTAEIAHEIGEFLQQANSFTVDVCEVSTVRTVDPYDAVILGSAIYAGNWPGEAADFIRTYQEPLSRRAVWMFSSGPLGEAGALKPVDARVVPESLQPVADAIHPRGTAVFAGKLDPERLSFFERSVARMVHAPAGDFRDWDAIDAWAHSIAEALKEHVTA